MRRIKNFKLIKEGDWILVRKSPYSRHNKTHTIIIVNKRFLIVYGFNYRGIMEKFRFTRNHLKNLLDFYPNDWGKYKLNKKERERWNRKIILGSLK